MEQEFGWGGLNPNGLFCESEDEGAIFGRAASRTEESVVRIAM